MPSARRERLRFEGFEFQRFENGQCRATVVLEGLKGERYRGTAEGILTREGELRCGAEATLHALQTVTGERVPLELVGIKAVRAFDATVVIVCLGTTREGRRTQRVGASLAMDDPVRGAATAVLHATNRMLGNVFESD